VPILAPGGLLASAPGTGTTCIVARRLSRTLADEVAAVSVGVSMLRAGEHPEALQGEADAALVIRGGQGYGLGRPSPEPTTDRPDLLADVPWPAAPHEVPSA
jgi:hypothetical protein